MKITYEDRGPLTIFAVKGELSIDEADRFRREAMQRLDDDVRDFVLDFEELDFIDSRGLETLLWLQDRCAELLGQVRIACCPNHVNKVLEITRLSARFECYADIDRAIQSLQ
ncbi:MAG: STAS domain-containing protein [Planctomycetota bacterium]